MKYFYHGTTVSDITILNNSSKSHWTEEKTVVYLTPNRAYALFYIIDKAINHITCGVDDNGIVNYHEQFPSQLSVLYKGMSGYMYKCEDNSCTTPTATNDVWASTEPVVVCDKEYITDVFEEIKQYEKAGKINIIRYETHDETKNKNIFEMECN